MNFTYLQAGYKDVIEGLEARYNSNKFVNPHNFKRTVFVAMPKCQSNIEIGADIPCLTMRYNVGKTMS